MDEEGGVGEVQHSAPQQPATVFWDELLKSGYQELQQSEMAALGKGKRERRQVHPLQPSHPELAVAPCDTCARQHSCISTCPAAAGCTMVDKGPTFLRVS